ncbi:MAG: methionine aminotransferase [Bacteroidetes bacterium RIFCSPLOWO2_12_FULL_37_12]|nr:MAG: methionine aminotransferase [Bacteroidetes bacterium RIFCSPLOWO2_12_FULL_37_12]
MHPIKTFPPISSKLPHAGTTIFTVMSELANQHSAINLSQGFPDFNCSEKLISLVNKYMLMGKNQYAPMQGLLPLREKIAVKTNELYGATYNPADEITITAGGTQALYTAITAVVHKGDEVIVLEPAYDSYIPAIQLSGGIPVYVGLKPPLYKIDWEQVQRVITSNTKLIILNSPHNPTGTVFSKEDIFQLIKITENKNIFILSDEVYEHIIFDNHPHESVCKYPELRARSFVVFSFGKTYHTTGWKIGYCLAPKELTVEFRKVHQFITFCTNTPIQWALNDFIEEKNNYLCLHKFYEEKRDLFVKLINDSKFKFIPAKGTYFQLLSFDGLTDEKDTDFAMRITKDYGVASVPVSVFYHDKADYKMLRFCFAKEAVTLEKAAERIRGI